MTDELQRIPKPQFEASALANAFNVWYSNILVGYTYQRDTVPATWRAIPTGADEHFIHSGYETREDAGYALAALYEAMKHNE